MQALERLPEDKGIRMKVLVTGASGSIGSRVVARFLRAGYQVRGLVRPTSNLRWIDTSQVELCYGDMTDTQSLWNATRGVDIIVHSAAPVDDWVPDHVFQAVNIEGVKNLAEAALQHQVKRFIQVSSVNVYGVDPPPHTNEETPFQPCGYAYCDTKIESEKILWSFHQKKGLPLVVLRPANVWGPTAGAWTIRPLDQIRKRKMILIDRGRGSFNSTYVDHFANACLLAAENPSALGQAFIITDGITTLTMKSFFDSLAMNMDLPVPKRSVPKWLALVAASGYETLAAMSGRRPRVTRFVVHLLTKNCYYDVTKSRQILGFQPQYSFEEAMAQTVDWLLRETHPE